MPPQAGATEPGACVSVCRASRGARTCLPPLAEVTDQGLSNCYRRRFWRHCGALLGEIAPTGGGGHSLSLQEPHFLGGFLGRWRHSPPLRRSCRLSPAEPGQRKHQVERVGGWARAAAGPQQHGFSGALSFGAWPSEPPSTPRGSPTHRGSGGAQDPP